MKVLLVDDHPLILSALKAMMERIKPEVEVTALGSALELRRLLAGEQTFDLILLDLHLEDDGGFGLLAEVRRRHTGTPVVVVSASDRSTDVIQAIDMGAMGFLPKRMSTEDLTNALRLVMDGGIFVPAMNHTMVDSQPTPSSPTAPGSFATSPAGYQTTPSFEGLGLTPRQADVLGMLLQGKPNKDIARRLGLSVETVKDHVQAVLRALGVSSRTQAVLAVGRMTQQGGFPRF